jgi:hypothetical protein
VYLIPPSTTPDDLLRMNELADDGSKYELFDGILVREGGDLTSAGHAVLCQRPGPWHIHSDGRIRQSYRPEHAL